LLYVHSQAGSHTPEGSVVALTFHCVILDRYPIEAVQLNIHMSSE